MDIFVNTNLHEQQVYSALQNQGATFSLSLTETCKGKRFEKRCVTKPYSDTKGPHSASVAIKFYIVKNQSRVLVISYHTSLPSGSLFMVRHKISWHCGSENKVPRLFLPKLVELIAQSAKAKNFFLLYQEKCFSISCNGTLNYGDIYLQSKTNGICKKEHCC